MAGRSVEETVDDGCDLPQSVAMHILQSLVHDATLSVSILPWIEAIVGLCIDSFAHPHWSIRNAALQVRSIFILSNFFFVLMGLILDYWTF